MLQLTIIPEHPFAAWLLDVIDRFLDLLGLNRHPAVEQVVYFLLIVIASYFIGWLIKTIIVAIARKITKFHTTEIGQDLLKQQTLSRCAHFIPPLVFLSLAPFAFEQKSEILTFIINLSVIYLFLTIGIAINAILKFGFMQYNQRRNQRNLPIKGILNLSMGIVWIVVVIICVSIIVHKSPAALLGGLTAFAAVVMLIFKDSILGCVAGVQLSSNDMLRVGDWIVVPNTLANGVVVDVTLTTVKVQNFDNTMVMVPPYSLVSNSFQNWRAMSDSGVRRVAQSIYINPDSIKPLTDEMLANITKKFPEVQPFVDKMKKDGKTVAWDPGNAPVNGTLESNIGLFRAYMVTYLLASPMIAHDQDLMVCIQPMSPEGVPLQIYCFSVTTQWEAFEGVLSAVMEHAMLASSTFGLEILSADHLSVDTPDKKA
ncbi:MAG: mechanosensitive ion channel family protein [Bacteroidales bacterium]|nr:mechanosensitive ion channel family protein [Bacteroidales bacterium]